MGSVVVSRWSWWALFGSAAACAPSLAAETAPALRVVAPAYWCPFSCTSGGAQEGFAVDIARAALARQGVRLEYTNMPYDRALVEVRKGASRDAVVPAAREEAPDFVFAGEPASAIRYCFYALPGSTWRYTGVASLERLSFVASSGYRYGEGVDEFIQAHAEKSVTLLTGDDQPDRMIRMVLAGRVAALLDATQMIGYTLQQQRHAPGALQTVGCLSRVQYGYFAISPARPDARALAQRFDEGLRALRASGELRRILGRYGVEDWR